MLNFILTTKKVEAVNNYVLPTFAPSVWIFVYLNFKYVILRVFLFGEGAFGHA